MPGRSRKLKARVAMVLFYDAERKWKFQRENELLCMSLILKYFGTFEYLSKKLASSLTFKLVAKQSNDPFNQLQRNEGVKISKELASFLRHRLPAGEFSALDGSMDVNDIKKHLGYNQREIILASHPDYGNGKERFVVLQFLHPDSSTTTKMAALGGHSVEIMAPPGHYQLGKESLSKLSPLIHNTSAVTEISQSGFLWQNQRKGGINLSSGESSYKPTATHKIIIKAELAHENGFVFFGNRFSQVIFGCGMWEDGQWSGKIPIDYLEIQHR